MTWTLNTIHDDGNTKTLSFLTSFVRLWNFFSLLRLDFYVSVRYASKLYERLYYCRFIHLNFPSCSPPNLSCDGWLRVMWSWWKILSNYVSLLWLRVSLHSLSSISWRLVSRHFTSKAVGENCCDVTLGFAFKEPQKHDDVKLDICTHPASTSQSNFHPRPSKSGPHWSIITRRLCGALWDSSCWD